MPKFWTSKYYSKLVLLFVELKSLAVARDIDSVHRPVGHIVVFYHRPYMYICS